MDRRLIRPPAVAADRLAARLVDGFEVSARRLDVAGVSTALLEGGSGPPVVLLHGHGGFAESLAETIAELVDRYRVIAPDLPGLGRSELHGEQLGPAGLVEWLGRLIAATCTTPPILVGFSAGAGLALRHTLTARQVRRVVLVSPCSLGPLRLPLAVRRAFARFARNPDRSTADRLTRHLFYDADRVRAQLGSRFTAIEDYVIERARQPGARAANRALPQSISDDEQRAVSVPVSVICGSHDRIVPLAHTHHLVTRLGWPLVVIDEAGHLPYLEQRRTLAGALRSTIDPETRPPHQEEDQ